MPQKLFFSSRHRVKRQWFGGMFDPFFGGGMFGPFGYGMGMFGPYGMGMW